jgi:ABC-type branched-subunit amino acid transport system substrate-binding protein
MKLGILLPDSSTLPLIGHDFFGGIKAYVNYKNLQDNIEIITEKIGFGVDKEAIKTKASYLLMDQNVDALLVFADHPVVQVIFPLTTSLNKLLIIANNGAKYPANWQPAKNIIYNTLNEVLHASLSGLLAVNDGHTEAAMATSFYDGGYLLCHAISTAFYNSGGSITYNFISPHKAVIESYQSLKEQNPSRAILAVFSGDQAHYCLQALSDNKELCVYGSSMMLDETLIDLFGSLHIGFQLKGYVPWHANIATDENKIFLDSFKQTNKRNASLTGLQGWDNGVLIASILEDASLHNWEADKAINILKTKKLQGARGMLHLDDKTHCILSPSYLVEADNNYHFSITKTITEVQEYWDNMVKASTNIGTYSEWFNTYLCS